MFGVGMPPDSGPPAGAPDKDTTAGTASASVQSVQSASSSSSSPTKLLIATSVVVIYRPSDTSGALRQGEILSGVYQYRRSLLSLKSRTHELEEILHPYALVMSPDCDLEQDFAERTGQSKKEGQSDKLIPDVLLLQAIGNGSVRTRMSDITSLRQSQSRTMQSVSVCRR